MINITNLENIIQEESRENYKIRQCYDDIVNDLDNLGEEDLRKIIPSLVEVIKSLMTSNEEKSNLLLSYTRQLNKTTDLLGRINDQL